MMYHSGPCEWHIAAGDRVFVRPRDARVFMDDYSI